MDSHASLVRTIHQLCWQDHREFLIIVERECTICRRKPVQEDGQVAVVKRVIPTRIANPVQRVVEPELDMDRFRHGQLSTVGVFRQLLQKLLPAGHWAVRSPMRSIAREIEEVWPVREL
jgi:hypothetical protein